MQRATHAYAVGQVLLEPLDGFHEPLGRRILLHIIRRIVEQLLGQIEIGKLLPAPLSLAFVDLVLGHVRQNRRSQALDAGRDGIGLFFPQPLQLQRR